MVYRRWFAHDPLLDCDSESHDVSNATFHVGDALTVLKTLDAGVVLDPFAGTGTVLQVATGHSRDAIGIDLDPRNADLALERVGPLFMEVVSD
jgi:hypothetical protein